MLMGNVRLVKEFNTPPHCSAVLFNCKIEIDHTRIYPGSVCSWNFVCFLVASLSQSFAPITKRNLERPISAFGNRCCTVFWVRVYIKSNPPTWQVTTPATTGNVIDVKLPLSALSYGSALPILFVTNPYYTKQHCEPDPNVAILWGRSRDCVMKSERK